MMELLGAAGGIAGGVLGAQAADKAANMNWQINLMNYFQREREREEQIQESKTNKKEQQLGYQDANGNAVRFVRGKGWVATQGKNDKQLSDMQRAEQLAVLQKDVPMRRRAMARQEATSLEDAMMADTYRREMKSLPKGEDASLEHDLYTKATSGAREGHDNSLQTAMLQAMRTDSSNIGKITEADSRSRAKSYADARVDAALKSRGVANAEYDKKLGGLSQLFNMFAQRAGQQPAVAYSPTKIDTADGKELGALQKLGLQAGNFLAEAAGKKGGTVDYVQPNYGWANAVGGGGAALSSAFKSMSAQSQYNDRLRGNEA